MRRALMILLPVVIVAVGAYAAFTMIQNRPQPETREISAPAPLIQAIEVKPQTVRLTVHAEGTVSPRTETELVPEVSGRVIWVSPSLAAGGFFEEGETLLKIDRREYELEVVRARAAVAEAKLRLAREREEAEVARKEWENLGEGEPKPLVVREPQIAEAEAMLASAEAALGRAEYDLERTVVRAPFAGRVREKKVDVGQFVSRGTAIARLYSVDYAEVRLPVPDDQLAYVDVPLAYRDEKDPSQGPPVTLMADFAGQKYRWRGRVVRTEGEIDPRSRMIHVIAQVKDPYGKGGRPGRPPLAVGMFVEAEIQGKVAGNVIVLPRAALRDGDSVYVVDEGDRLHFREIGILRAEPERILVRSGLKPGERVAVSVLEAAVDGMKVRVMEDESGSASG